jgi:predicted GNAT family acetyltransferase
MSKVLAHEPDARRYTLKLNDQLAASADYVIDGESILFTHTFTVPTRRGEGLAGDVVAFAVDDVEANTTLRIVPMCSYVVEWFQAHPERTGLLSARG